MEVRLAGARALIVECGPDVAAWRAELYRRREVGDLVATEIVPGARTVLVDGVPDAAGLAARIAGWPAPPPEASTADRLVQVPVVYDGPDLATVARLWHTTPDEVVRRHTGTEFRVAFCGFAPGFGYLTGLPDDLSVPRLPTPRPRVPAGSVGLAGPYTGIYPTASPGGWLLIGRTDIPLLDLERDPPTLLAPGTRVRFVAVAPGATPDDVPPRAPTDVPPREDADA
ncbi:MAG TPA: 5-oxoprolinase subunit PxpB [Micromonosporaceae bacterium]